MSNSVSPYATQSALHHFLTALRLLLFYTCVTATSTNRVSIHGKTYRSTALGLDPIRIKHYRGMAHYNNYHVAGFVIRSAVFHQSVVQIVSASALLKVVKGCSPKDMLIRGFCCQQNLHINLMQLKIWIQLSEADYTAAIDNSTLFWSGRFLVNCQDRFQSRRRFPFSSLYCPAEYTHAQYDHLYRRFNARQYCTYKRQRKNTRYCRS